MQAPKNSETLHCAVRAIRAAKTAQRAFTRHPSLEVASRRLMDYLSERFPGSGEPLVQECLRAACRAFEAAAGDEERERLAYLTGLVREASQLTRKRVGVGEVFWVPFTESFAAFLERVSRGRARAELTVIDEAAPGEIAPYIASMMLAVRIMPGADASEVCAAYWKTGAMGPARAAANG